MIITVIGRVVRHSLAYLTMQKMVGGGRPLHEIWLKLTNPLQQGRIKTLGGPCQSVMGALPFPPLPFPLRPFLPPSPLPPLPPVPSSAISLPSFYRFSFRSGHLNTAMGPGERCKFPQWGLGQSPSRQKIWCIFESKRAALVAAIFL